MGKRGNVRRVPLSCLGPRALAQIAALGPGPDKKSFVEPAPKAVNKYGVSPVAERTAVDGQKFDSKLELAAYHRLQLLGISFTRQPEYELQNSFEQDGKKYRGISYRGDFLIPVPGQRPLCVDTKGFQTEAFKLKWKLLCRKYPDIRPVQIRTVEELTTLLSDNRLLRNQQPAENIPTVP